MRYHGPLLHLMTEVLERGRSGVPPFVQAVLRLGLTDLLLLETPSGVEPPWQLLQSARPLQVVRLSEL